MPRSDRPRHTSTRLLDTREDVKFGHRKGKTIVFGFHILCSQPEVANSLFGEVTEITWTALAVGVHLSR